MKIIHPCPIEELAESVVDSWRSVCQCTAKFLRHVWELDLRQGYKQWGYTDTAEFLDHRCGITRVAAREKVRVARRLAVLEKVEEAFAQGEISYSKVRALVRVAKPDTEDELLEFARELPASVLERRLRELRNGSSAQATVEAQRSHADRRLLSRRVEGDCFEINAQLSEEEAGLVLAAVDMFKREIAESGLESEGKWDDLALAADALVLMAKKALKGNLQRASEEIVDEETGEIVEFRDSAESSGHLVMVHVDESALRGKGGASDLPLETVKRLLCDGSLVGMVENGSGEPLSIGRKSRTVPTGMKRALQARDRTCRYPGCSHTRWLDAHHIKHWTRGGDTSMDNLVLLCSHHHRLLHEGGFQILSHPAGGHYFADQDGQSLDIGPYQSLAEGEEFWALRPWADGKEMFGTAAQSLTNGECCQDSSMMRA